MRIAQVAPLIESVPPQHYGGTERIVSYLTEELVRAGHDVTLFASGDSITRARLIAGCRGSLRLNKHSVDHLAHHLVMLDQVLEHAREFDVIHFHTDYLHFPVSRYLPVPHITTLHGRLDIPDLVPVYDRFRDIPVISISNSQRKPLPWANWVGTILPWTAARVISLSAKSRNLPGFSWTDIARKASGSSDRNREAGRNATQDCCQG